MNICNDIKTDGPKEFVPGNLYLYKNKNDQVYIATGKQSLVWLQNGMPFPSLYTEKYTDVTDQYCLQKVK